MNALAPVTPEAGSIAHLWWIFFWTCVAVYCVVMAVILAARWKHPDRAEPGQVVVTPAASEKRTRRIISAGAVATLLILLGLLTADLVAQREVGPRNDNPLVVRIVGHQWWWGVEYQSPNASDVFETANEVHVPVQRSIRLLLESNDVIHSFWVPELQGKKDLVPGHPAELTFKIEKPGRYVGQCAEFCGYQHANMKIIIVADEPRVYEQWAAHQKELAPPSTTPTQIRGREIFERGTCSMCHSARGTDAGSRLGPVLTHVASRSSLAAGTLANTRENLASWIVDPQHVKPGTLMPPTELSKTDLEALLDFMETLR